jgi:hypothetical protein
VRLSEVYKKAVFLSQVINYISTPRTRKLKLPRGLEEIFYNTIKEFIDPVSQKLTSVWNISVANTLLYSECVFQWACLPNIIMAAVWYAISHVVLMNKIMLRVETRGIIRRRCGPAMTLLGVVTFILTSTTMWKYFSGRLLPTGELRFSLLNLVVLNY